MIEYQRELGMRFEESVKFNPYCDAAEKQVNIHRGTKGGRPRWIEITNEKQQDVIEKAKSAGYYSSKKSTLIPQWMSEKQWKEYVYRTVRQVGLTKAVSGTMHGFRHAYAQARYLGLVGVLPPVCFATKALYIECARQTLGEGWKEKDEMARIVIREELGHSPGRDDIDGQYLGSWK